MDILLVEALKVACRAHAGQVDKSGEPYILHPIRVAFDYGLSTPHEQIVALLHDVIEDTPVTFAEIYAQFGSIIANAVASVSRGYVDPGTGNRVYKPTEGFDKELYIDFIIRARRNPTGRSVKIADLKDNLSPIRMNHLPLDQRGITKRYERALKLLTAQ